MGNSASTAFVTSTPRKLSWGRQREDTVQLEDFMTRCAEDHWKVKGRKSFSVKKIHRSCSIRYNDLAAQDTDISYPKTGAMLNPAFVGDQGPWMTEFKVSNSIYGKTQQDDPPSDVWRGKQPLWSHCNMADISSRASPDTVFSPTTWLKVWTHKQEGRPQYTFRCDQSLL